jgi:hypothetical protein
MEQPAQDEMEENHRPRPRRRQQQQQQQQNQARQRNEQIELELNLDDEVDDSMDNNEDEEECWSSVATPETELLEVTTTLHIIQGDYNLNRSHATAPILSPDDACSICLCQWDQFTDVAIVAVLKCSLAYCASCLADMHKECTKTQSDQLGTYRLPFCCSLCRSTIKPEILDDLAATVVNKGLIVSFAQFVDQSASYEASREERKRIVVSVLGKTCRFDVVKAEIHLFNLLQMILHDSSLDLNSNQKVEYFELARAPVRQLEAEHKQLRDELEKMCCKESDEWKSLYFKMKSVYKKIAEARSNASKVKMATAFKTYFISGSEYFSTFCDYFLERTSSSESTRLEIWAFAKRTSI